MIKQLSLFKKDANVKFVTINLYKSGTIMIQGLNTCVQWKEKFYNQIKAQVNHQTSNTDEITYTSDSASVNNQLDYDDKHDKAPSEQSDNFETRISKLENSIQGIDSTLCDINLKCSNIINSNGDIHTLKAEVAIIKKDLELLLPNIKNDLCTDMVLLKNRIGQNSDQINFLKTCHSKALDDIKLEMKSIQMGQLDHAAKTFSTDLSYGNKTGPMNNETQQQTVSPISPASPKPGPSINVKNKQEHEPGIPVHNDTSVNFTELPNEDRQRNDRRCENVKRLILTDSIGRRLNGGRMDGNKSTWTQFIPNGIVGLIDFLENSPINLVCEKVALITGTREIRKNKTDQQISEQCLNLLKLANNKFPNSKITLCGLLPSVDLNHRINMYNNMLTNLCKQHNVEYLNIYQIVCENNIPSEYYYHDEVHLNNIGLSRLAKLIKHNFGLQTKLPLNNYVNWRGNGYRPRQHPSYSYNASTKYQHEHTPDSYSPSHYSTPQPKQRQGPLYSYHASPKYQHEHTPDSYSAPQYHSPQPPQNNLNKKQQLDEIMKLLANLIT
ncbi:hypothetical protein SNE40_018184 [Patella caerulea]|uniref:SGNH hydrolase-type esterase domain-containing protein n=3 Tax=Patella caerulea TaxID=87958 RepID=A0AAN8PJI9_PATCE